MQKSRRLACALYLCLRTSLLSFITPSSFTQDIMSASGSGAQNTQRMSQVSQDAPTFDSLTSPTTSEVTIVDSRPHIRQDTNTDAQAAMPRAEVQSGVYSDDCRPGQSGSSPEKGDGSPSTTVQTVHIIGQATGWAAMAEDIRNYDEDRVRECRDDIDTLMTFAGLFSAAITAFLVESYQALLPNVAGETLQVLRLIALQNLDKNATELPLNLSVLASSGPSLSFKALVLVNAFWFASLLSSLIAASFSMVVKQWLREYLAVNNPSAQARLRVRQFREPSLGTWGVFEIAAALPFLLQFSLALFFAGLCIFTASVHTAVGTTSLILVLAWASCFVAVTLLPIFFPRCPYKTTFLKKALRSMHAALHCIIATLMPHRISILDSPPPDEKAIAKDATRDLAILIDVDELQADDELLGTNMLEGIGQFRRPDLPDLVDFLKHILNHRCQLVSKEDPKANDLPWPTNSDIRVLSERGKKAIIDIIEKYACRDDLDTTVRDFSTAMDQLCVFLMLPNLRPLPLACTNLVRERLRNYSDLLHSSNILLNLALRQWCRRLFDGFERDIWSSDIWAPFQLFHSLYEFDFYQRCSHLQTLTDFYRDFAPPLLTSAPDGWMNNLAADNLSALAAFIYQPMLREMQRAYTDHTPLDVTSRSRRETFNFATSTVITLCHHIRTWVPADSPLLQAVRTGLADVLVAALISPNQTAIDDILEAYTLHNSAFYIETLGAILSEVRRKLASLGQLKLALENYTAFVRSRSTPDAALVVTIDQYIKLCLIGVHLTTTSGETKSQRDYLCSIFAETLSQRSQEIESNSPKLLLMLNTCRREMQTRNITHNALERALSPPEPNFAALFTPQSRTNPYHLRLPTLPLVGFQRKNTVDVNTPVAGRPTSILSQGRRGDAFP